MATMASSDTTDTTLQRCGDGIFDLPWCVTTRENAVKRQQSGVDAHVRDEASFARHRKLLGVIESIGANTGALIEREMLATPRPAND
jgi:hypothetical protein